MVINKHVWPLTACVCSDLIMKKTQHGLGRIVFSLENLRINKNQFLFYYHYLF